MILNLGTMFIAFIFILSLPMLLVFTKPCAKCSQKFKKKHIGCRKSLSGNLFIRYFLESCLEITICVSLNYIFSF